MTDQQPALLWQADEKTRQNAHLQTYLTWLTKHHQRQFDNYAALWRWSVDEPAAFWETVWAYFSVINHAPYQDVLSGLQMPGARWFEGARLNYAEHIFRKANDANPAILFQNERQALTEISWKTLKQQTATLAQFLRNAGIKPGDRIAAYLPNTPHAIVAVLAAMSIGAVWSSCSPDFGANSVADRFVQIEPKVLITVDGYTYGGKSFDKQETVQEICRLLPSLQTVIFIPYLNANAQPNGLPNAVFWDDVVNSGDSVSDQLEFESLPFEHPIWILYSSGTTGIPKAITHAHGGNLIEHLKYLHFHNDVHPGERFFWYSTTGWMMWNFTLAAMLTGASIVLYDGSPGYPNLNVLWELAQNARITHFGTSAPFLVSCMKNGLVPKNDFDLSPMRGIGSTGSPLPPEAFDWVYENVKPDIWLSSMAGGTDVCTAWVGGNPLLPVYEGEIQCRCLGCAMESWDEDGKPVPAGSVGEMVVTKPMPSMPVYFWNDPDGERYRTSYFEEYPGVWRQGDWLCITPRDSLIILGRSDATLNRQGVRIGTAEIYRALDKIPAIQDSLVINLERPDGSDWMPLFVTLAEGATLDDALIALVRKTLRSDYSPRHVPDAIFVVPEIPYTISGKKMETPVKKILQRKPLDKAYNRDSMKNPSAMDFFIAFADKQTW
ncbi:MAG: acetoacetate--CoA ligase [Lewinellaceae bacterium]|nr:acetoacetate--CoA ligase [Saprospiraceae bacterium]MCB9329518.1 acetoacetate--CoA ligase [Lewinellaceae bacterium]